MLLSLQIMAILTWKEIPCVENLQIACWENCRNTNIYLAVTPNQAFFVIATLTWDIFFVV